MLVPVNTDAPIYHFPAATIGLIITNVVVFVLTGAGNRPDLADPWILWFGAIRPYQWLTAFFMHAGFGHLIGNMVFLWAFGLVVEGKLGWKKFTLVYLAVGISQCAVEQFIMVGSDRQAARLEQLDALDGLILPDDGEVEGALFQIDDNWPRNFDGDQKLEEEEFVPPPEDFAFQNRRERALIRLLRTQPVMFGALGASGAIYSLMAMSLIWAPKNCMTIVGLIWLRPVSFQVSIMMFSVFYIGLDFFIAAAGSFAMSTAFLHTMGAITGGIFGVLMFKAGKVDCEDWDLFSVLSGNYGPHVRDIYGYKNEQGKKTKYDEKPANKPKKKKKSKLEEINAQIDKAEYLTAAEGLFFLRVSQPRVKLSEEQLKELGLGLVAARDFEEAESILEEYIQRHPDSANWACIRLAAIQLQENQQPRACMRTLRGVVKSSLRPGELETCKKLAKLAKQQIASGVEDRQAEWE
jgi:membrane associated rhomboid family serine protease